MQTPPKQQLLPDPCHPSPRLRGGFFTVLFICLQMTTLDLFNVGNDAPWQIVVDLRDCRDYTRNYYLIPLSEELAEEGSMFGSLRTRIKYHLLDTHYTLKGGSAPSKR